MEPCCDVQPAAVCSTTTRRPVETESCCNVQLVAVCTVQDSDRRSCFNGLDSTFERMMAILNLIAYLLILAVCIYVSIVCFTTPVTLFRWHPFCMTIGLFGFTTMAILMFSKYNLVSCNMAYQSRYVWHWIMQGIGLMFIIAGFAIIVENKDNFNKPHFTSCHGIIGLIAFIMLLLTFILALLIFIGKCICTTVKRRMQLLIHITLGVVTYIIGLLVLLLGLASEWFIANAGLIGAIICCILVLLVTTLVLWSPLSRKLSNVDKTACKPTCK